jgi:ABC-2 type transport system ATP-binding protein
MTVNTAGGAPPPAEQVLEVTDLVVAHGAQVAVNGISFGVTRGQIFGLLGPNGAGKTSTLNAVEGLLKPAAGSILVDGIDVRRDPLGAKSRLGVQLQASSFQPELAIEQVVTLYAGLYGLRLARHAVLDHIRAAGLGSELGKAFKSLSGGQQQRLALLIAVLNSPLLLLLDEPTAGLDPQSRRQLWDRIEHLRSDGGSILLTTHSMEEAQAVCDRIAIIDHGTLLTVDTPADLIAAYRTDPRVLAVARGEVTLEDVFIALTGSSIRD